MTAPDVSGDQGMREPWEKEILARHRWGQHGDDRASEELARLGKLWDAAQPLGNACRDITRQIVALEICNWNLEESILSLCKAIGVKLPAGLRIGHMGSISEDRWAKIWAYYLTLRNWLLRQERSTYEVVLRVCDPDRSVQNRVSGLLGDSNELKELYTQRFCRCLEFWLGGPFPRQSAQMKVHAAAVAALEEEIRKRDPEGRILGAFHLEGDGRLNPCHHKLFRRYDIILSSIGAGKWRAAMPMRGTDGARRAETLERFLSPIEAWIRGSKGGSGEDELSGRICALLGEPDAARSFLASVLVSLLRSQQLAARRLAEKRSKP